MRLFKKIYAYILRKINSIIEIIKYYSLYPIAFLKYRNNNIYLVSERGVDARDNGYHFFRYLKEKHPELETYYIIDKKSVDFGKVEPFGNIVQYRSLKHYLLFIAAKYKISTHIMGFSPNTPFYTSFNLKHRIKGKLIFLQHGVTQGDLIGLYQERTKIDVFICGAKPEYDYVNNNFHYKNGEVCYTGFARYDALHKYTIKRQILVMPTWRVYLKTLKKEELLSSQYFTAWNNFMKDERLVKFLEKEGIELIFYPHYEMQPYIAYFQTASPQIKIADFLHYDVQTLLKESTFLITDYSSVFFDFAYMQKPSAYYQFDREEFFSKHYQKGYFDYEKDGFGPVAKDLSTLIEIIINQGKALSDIKDIYYERCKAFFPFSLTVAKK